MENYCTLEQALASAFSDGDQKIEDGKFIMEGADYDWDDPKNFIDGDPENIHTLISLYGQDLNPNDEPAFEAAMRERYAAYCLPPGTLDEEPFEDINH